MRRRRGLGPHFGTPPRERGRLSTGAGVLACRRRKAPGTGYLASRLGELGKGLAAFAEESGRRLAPPGRHRISEFDRTFRENGNRGTDHGHGSVYWALGGAVRGGRVAGEQVAVAPGSLFQNRDYPVLNEYRAVLGGVFARLYGLSPAQLQQVFPGSMAKDIGLV